MTTTQKILYKSFNLDWSDEEYCKRVGQDAAVLKAMGRTDEQIKQYVKRALVRVGETRSESLEAEGLARGQYVKALKAIKEVETEGYTPLFKGVLHFNGGEIYQVKTTELSKCGAANWLMIELNR